MEKTIKDYNDLLEILDAKFRKPNHQYILFY
ncbi:hypothetical protein SAMN05421578_102105 [Paenibacillus macquariensis]|uniref:Uncharacterized protein n=1 Tax=Paenibacillus macquariensis TaxID=948756 RepID=A0ABY1JMF8_9BACL|nr:hypothetical protein SAMN05421578_102105 [Paenibacillus macquariensis]